MTERDADNLDRSGVSDEHEYERATTAARHAAIEGDR